MTAGVSCLHPSGWRWSWSINHGRVLEWCEVCGAIRITITPRPASDDVPIGEWRAAGARMSK